MKIRTDFVTNSSSYSTTEVVIDNLVLLEILQKYKDLGLFGENDPIIGIGTYESMDERFYEGSYHDYTKTPAFFYFEDQNDEGSRCLFLVDWVYPKTLDKVLESIIRILDIGEDYLDGRILSQVKDEIQQRKDEIDRAYSRVYWKHSGWNDSFTYSEKFEYDRIRGESFTEDNPDGTEEEEYEE